MNASMRPMNPRRIADLEYVIDTLPVAGRRRECVVDCTPALAATPDEAVEMAELRRNTPWSDQRRGALADRVATYWPALQRWWANRQCAQIARALESSGAARDLGSLFDGDACEPRLDPPGVILGDGRVMAALQHARHEAREAYARGDSHTGERATDRVAHVIDAIEWCRRSLDSFDSLHEWEDRAVEHIEACDRRLDAHAQIAMPARERRAETEQPVCRTLAPGR